MLELHVIVYFFYYSLTILYLAILGFVMLVSREDPISTHGEQVAKRRVMRSVGTIAVGKLANFAIYDTDFLNADLDAVWDAKLQATIVDGKEV